MAYCFQENGGAHINAMIREAAENGTRTCTVSGNWEIEQAILLPSDFTLVLDGCHLRMKDGVVCNMFNNEHINDLTPAATWDYDITIEGRGRAIVDGGEPNELNERVFKADPSAFPGITHNAVNSILMFAHVDGLRISGLQVRNHRYWALTFAYCCRGMLSHIDFRSDDTWTDEEGNLHHGFFTGNGATYDAIRVKNADGIDLRCGCHDFIIENITGFTEDDTVAINCIWGNVPKAYYAEGDCKDIWNVIVRNVNAASRCALVRLLNADGNLLHDILIDGIFDALRDCRYSNYSLAYSGLVKIGDSHPYFREFASRPGEVYNITVKDVHSIGKKMALKVECNVSNLKTEQIFSDWSWRDN